MAAQPSPESVFCKVYGAQESIPRNEFRLSSLAGRYDNPIPTRFLAPIDCLKTPALPLKNRGRGGAGAMGAL
jgi:hypothetical protein